MTVHPALYVFYRVWAAIGLFLTTIIWLVAVGFINVAVNI